MGPWRHQLYRRRTAIIAGLLSMVLVLILIGRFSGGKSVLLSDGSRLSFRGVSVGLRCSQFYGSIIARLGQSTLPDGMQGLLPAGTMVTLVHPESNVVFWLHQDRAPAPTAPPRSLRFTLADDQGVTVILPGTPSVQSLPGGGRALAVVEPVWPRTARRMVLSVFDEGLETPTQLAGQWTIDNPAPVARAPWPATRAPVAQRIGDVILTLEQFEVRPMPVMQRRLSRTNVVEPMGFVQFTCTNAAGAEGPASAEPRPGRPEWPGWGLAAIRLLDATGNSRGWKLINPDADHFRDGRTSVAQLKIPWPGEALYQVETCWRPTNPGVQHELIPVREVVLSPAPPETGLVGGGRYAGGEFQLYASRSRDVLAPGWRLRAVVLRRTLALDPLHEVSLVEAVDGGDRRWVADARGELVVPLEVETVAVTVDVRALRRVTFTAAPVRRMRSLPGPRG